MMASNLISRILSPNNGSPSIYETIRDHDKDAESSDLDQRAGQAIDEENLGEQFQDLDLEHANLQSSHVTAGNDFHTHSSALRVPRTKASRKTSRSNWKHKSRGLVDVEEVDDDVPASLLIEGTERGQDHSLLNLPPPPSAVPVVENTTGRVQEQWEPAETKPVLRGAPKRTLRTAHGLGILTFADPKEKAMWRWANVENLDNFLHEIYNYYLGHGFWSILLHRALSLVTLAFVVGFSYFLGACIDYRSIRGSNKMSEIVIPRCMNKMGAVPNIMLWLITFVWISKVFQYFMDIRRLRNLHDFYLYLLDIPEEDIQTISWQDIVSRLMALRDSNPNIVTNVSSRKRQRSTQNKERLDAHDIANRLMRRENYMIAMVNKEILDLTLPIPFLRNRQLFSRTLEWNINQAIMDYAFNRRGQIRQLFLKDTHRKALSEGLRRRFVFAGTANLIIAPFLIVYFLVQYFFQYFNEYQKNPAQIGSRQYNPLAEWKFREFNELYHLFQKRVNMSYPFATRYVNQFPKDKTIQTARFVAFVSGALASVLALASVIDPELFLGFEITKDRTVLFYLGIFGSVWAVARGLLPDDNTVYDPEIALNEVIEFTHYKPAHWDDRLHSNEVRTEFVQLYQMKIVITLEEVLSMIFTPFVLWFSLPKCSDRIIDFFREFTVHVDGIGYVCSFAEFNFQKPGTTPIGTKPRTNSTVSPSGGQYLREEYYATKDQKLEASYWGFMNDYARNPKTDVRFPYARRRFHPPPPAPGLMSPSLFANPDYNSVFATSRQGIGQDRISSPSRPLGIHKSTSKFQEIQSPIMSLLLDPHHQPASLVIKTPQQVISARNVVKPNRKGHGVGRSSKLPPVPAPGEEEALEEEEDRDVQNGMPAEQGHSGGELGSWKINEEEYEDDVEDEDEDVDALTRDKGAGGVLGLIRKFQKTHGEGPGNGIGATRAVGV